MDTQISKGQDLSAALQKLSQAQTKRGTAAAKQSDAQSLFNSKSQYIEQAKEQTTTDSTGNTTKETIMEKILNPEWQEALNALNDANEELSGAEEEVSGAEEEVSKAEEAKNATEETEETEEVKETAKDEEGTETQNRSIPNLADPAPNFFEIFGDYIKRKGSMHDKAKDKLQPEFGDVDPNKYAQKFADENDITFEEAKEKLKSQFGDPTPATNSDVHYETVDGISPEKTPDTYAQEYADENNMTLDEAKAELQSKFGNPDADKYAEAYATANGITLEEAKNILKEKYGDPSTTTDSTTDLTSDTIPEGVDPDTYAQEYATANGITLEEAKEILKDKFKEPKFDETRNNDSTYELTEQEQELQNKGIPVEIIKQGNDAIRKYAKDHNIELKNPQ